MRPNLTREVAISPVDMADIRVRYNVRHLCVCVCVCVCVCACVCFISLKLVSVKLSKRRTDGRKKRRVSSCVRPSVCSFVSLSVASVRGTHPMGERTAMLHRNLRGI